LTAVNPAQRRAGHDAAMTRILIIQGHPDATSRHFGHALADAYTSGAREGGHELRTIDVARLDFPLLRSPADWKDGMLPPALAPAQQDILWAEHLLFFFPLWMGDMPALLKAFIEQVARPGFAFDMDAKSPMGHKPLRGRSARVVVTMGMPALVYRWYFRAHSVKSLERNVLGFIGIAPVHETLVGNVETPDEKVRAAWLTKLRRLGASAA
jgi:putative NADPH-quinone reductase